MTELLEPPITHAANGFGRQMNTQKDFAEIIELTTNLSICADPQRFDPTVGPERAKEIVADLLAMTEKLPLQSRRDEESERFQQFSTPIALAYIVSWVANLSKDDVVLEPSAGTGGLCAFALNSGCTVYANEISERRIQLLRAMPVAKVFTENAEQIHNILDPKISPTVIIANPPFSTSGTRMNLGDKVRGAAMIHVDQMLLRLRDGGRLVVIIGDRQRRGAADSDMSGRGMASVEWWNNLCANYAVRCSIGIPGEAYRKFGANYPVRLLVADKCRPCTKPTVYDASSLTDVLTSMPNIGITNEAESGS